MIRSDGLEAERNRRIVAAELAAAESDADAERSPAKWIALAVVCVLAPSALCLLGMLANAVWGQP